MPTRLQLEAATRYVEGARKELEKYDQKLRAAEDDVKAKDKLLDDTNAGRLARRYQYAWYAAIAGWVVSLLLALGLVAASGKAPAPPLQGSSEGMVVREEEPPHTIT